MGIPYSREINAAFNQVTPLVAAGYKVLRTTKNISILLAAIQVLTVALLGAILAVLVALLYTVNPDLEEERHHLITPPLKHLAHISLLGVLKTIATCILALSAVAYAAWRAFLFEQWVEDVEYEANVDVDAERVVGEVDGGDGGDGGKGGVGRKGKGKGKEGKGEGVLGEEGK